MNKKKARKKCSLIYEKKTANFINIAKSQKTNEYKNSNHSSSEYDFFYF